MKIIHYGGAKGVTGSCHELWVDNERSILIDCGLFQGNDVSQTQTETEQLKIDFPIGHIEALIVTYCQIDHVGVDTLVLESPTPAEKNVRRPYKQGSNPASKTGARS